MLHEDRVAYVRYLSMWMSREPTHHEVRKAALCLPPMTTLKQTLAAASEVAGEEFIVRFRGVDIPEDEQDGYTLGDLTDLTMMV